MKAAETFLFRLNTLNLDLDLSSYLLPCIHTTSLKPRNSFSAERCKATGRAHGGLQILTHTVLQNHRPFRKVQRPTLDSVKATPAPNQSTKYSAISPGAWQLWLTVGLERWFRSQRRNVIGIVIFFFIFTTFFQLLFNRCIMTFKGEKFTKKSSLSSFDLHSWVTLQAVMVVVTINTDTVLTTFHVLLHSLYMY